MWPLVRRQTGGRAGCVGMPSADLRHRRAERVAGLLIYFCTDTPLHYYTTRATCGTADASAASSSTSEASMWMHEELLTARATSSTSCGRGNRTEQKI